MEIKVTKVSEISKKVKLFMDLYSVPANANIQVFFTGEANGKNYYMNPLKDGKLTNPYNGDLTTIKSIQYGTIGISVYNM